MKKLQVSFLIIPIILLLLSCGAKEKKNEKSDKHGGFISLSKLNTAPTSIDPRKIELDNEMSLYSSIFRGLTRINPNSLEVEPAIAKSWSSSANCKVFDFVINKNLFFHQRDSDSEPTKLTIEDLKKCMDLWADTIKPNPAYDLIKDKVIGAKIYHESIVNGSPKKEGISGIQIINDSTLRVSLNYSFCTLPELFARINFSIYNTSKENPYSFNNIASTGPFKVHSIDTSKLTLVRNNLYNRYDSKGFQLPYLDSIIFLHGNQVNSFEKKIELYQDGKLHIIDKIRGKNIDVITEKLDPKNYTYDAIELFATHTLVFNHSQNHPTHNINLRKAIILGLDRFLIVDSILNGENWYANDGYNISYCFYDDTVKSIPYELNKAKKIIKENKLSKDTLHFLAYSKSNFSLGIAQILRDKLGLTIEIDSVDSYDKLFEKIYKGDFDLVLNAWLLDYVSPESSLMGYYGKNLSKNMLYETKNFTRYKDSIFDFYYEAGIAEEDETTRNQYFKIAEKRLINNYAFNPLYYFEFNSLYSNQLKNYHLNGLELIDYERLYLLK